MAATPAERLQSVRGTASLLYKKMMEKVGYGHERLKEIVEKEAEEEDWRIEPYSLAFVPGSLKIQEMCDKAVEIDPYALWYVPDYFKTQEMCHKAVRIYPYLLEVVPDHLKIEEMCIKALEVDPWLLKDVLDYFKTQKMCDKAFWQDTFSLQYVPDWFVTQQQIKSWHYYDDYYNDDKLKWYDGYQKRKAQKPKIKEELLPIAWHPSRVID